MARVWVRKSGRKDKRWVEVYQEYSDIFRVGVQQCLGKDNVPNVDCKSATAEMTKLQLPPRLHQCCVACAFYASATVL